MASTSNAVLEVQHLRKTYGNLIAVDDISFEIQRGEIFGMVGPNGAGKTTAIECIEGFRRRDAGIVRMLGMDIDRNLPSLRSRMGIQSQHSGLQSRLRVWEVLDLFASFYERAADWRTLLDQVELLDKSDSQVGQLSGGQRQRLFIALALINDPELLFLDELSTGLDPHARRRVWDIVRRIRERGKTIFLTTHSMEEAERLCDHVAIIDHGRLVALDTPVQLVRQLGRSAHLVFTFPRLLEPGLFSDLSSVTHIGTENGCTVVHGRGEHVATEILAAVSNSPIAPFDVRTEQPSLEDVFLELTGKAQTAEYNSCVASGN